MDSLFFEEIFLQDNRAYLENFGLVMLSVILFLLPGLSFDNVLFLLPPVVAFDVQHGQRKIFPHCRKAVICQNSLEH